LIGVGHIVGQKKDKKIQRLNGARRKFVALASLGAALGLAGCSGVDLGGVFKDTGSNGGPLANNQPPANAQPAKVALLLPLSAPGRTASIAAALKKAAELALLEAGKTNVILITKDTRGNAQSAAAAAQAAVDEGAEIILGPLLGANVAAITPVATARNVPIMAFSTVSRVARPGVYLMSFLPEEEVANVLRHSSSTGIRSVAALLPQSQYGAVIEKALKTTSARLGIKIVATERYNRNGQNLAAAAARIARAVNSPTNPAQAVFIPEGGQNLRAIGTALAQAGFSSRSTRVLGTGLWDSSVTNGTPIAFGGWFAGVSPAKVRAFNQRYSASYQSTPPRIASLAYDAMALTVAFARAPIGTRFTARQITNVEGYNGVNGLFRFRPDGRIERGLAILQVTAAGNKVAAPAPGKFQFGF
jgi:outer membrane PBP1 activator LpoA protein